MYLAKIVRALSSNKIDFEFLQKVNYSIATKLCVKLINKCIIFKDAPQNLVIELCRAFFFQKYCTVIY